MTQRQGLAADEVGRHLRAVQPSAAGTVNARIEFLTGSKAGTTVLLSGETLPIGRRRGQGIAFPPGEIVVSADHATVLFRDGHHVLRDDGSRNGTFVNQEPITERELVDGDLIQFGFGGPLARFSLEGSTEYFSTFETRKSAETDSSPADRESAAETFGTRELLALSERRARARARRLTLAGIATAAVVLAGIVTWLKKGDAEIRGVQDGVANVRARSDSLRLAVLENERRVAADPRLDLATIRRLSRGVAFIVFSYGFADRASGEWLREARDAAGRVIRTEGPRGDSVAELVIGGAGPPVLEEGTASAFLVDQSGLLVTNRHVAEPWKDDPELPLLRARGKDVIGRFFSFRAYFPPGDQSFDLTVKEVSYTDDVAVLQTNGGRVHAPVLTLASASRASAPGEQVVYIGYPAGARNLLFRVPESVGGEILGVAGENERILVAELAKRHLIQPVILDARISDTTAIDIVHTATTAAGGSGGPLISADHLVVAVHYAAVTPIAGEAFTTQRAVPVRHVWELLKRSR